MQNDGSKNFDDIIKNKLQGLSMDASPSDWIMMERMLEWEGLTQDGEVTDETRFDEIAHDKLNNVPTDGLTPDWSRMSGLIDEMNVEPSIEPSEFDQAIDNRIKDTAVGFNMTVWDRMEPVLDADRAAIVDDLDAVAKEKLTQISEIQPAWGSMDSKINRELFLPESIVKYKVLEIALILLFAFSVSQFPLNEVTEHIATKTTRIQPETIVDAPVAPIETIIPAEEKVVIEATDVEPSKQIVSAKGDNLIMANDVISEIPETGAPEVNSAADLSKFVWQLPPTIAQLLEELKAKPRFSISEYVFNQVLDPIDLPRYSAMSGLFQLSDITKDPNSAESTVDFKEFENAAAHLSALSDINGLGMESISHAVAKPVVDDEDLPKQRRKPGLVLGAFTGSDYNQIITPFDPLADKVGSTQWNIGYTGGLSLGVRFKKWELETGAIYSSNLYDPNIVEFNGGVITAGYPVRKFDEIEIETVKVPLNFRFNVNIWDKWKVYALSGASVNMVVQSEFTLVDEIYGSPPIKQSFSPGVTPSATSSIFDKKDFSEGIFEGGSFKNNSFFTANLGLGVERTIGNSWSVFAQPTYQRQIFSKNGIGPNKDRYNVLSLFLGTRVALSSKARIKD